MRREAGTCPDCGFDWEASPAALQESLRSAHQRFLEAMGGATEADLRRRPSSAVWSALEYAAHTRDVVAFYAERIVKTLSEDRPRLTSPDWALETDARQYHSEATEDVLNGIRASCEALAELLTTLSEEDWHRTAIGSTGEHRDVSIFARGATHETEHHCQDARNSLAKAGFA